MAGSASTTRKPSSPCLPAAAWLSAPISNPKIPFPLATPTNVIMKTTVALAICLVSLRHRNPFLRLTSSIDAGPEPSDYDIWKSASGVTGGPDDDDDKDGQSNRIEYIFGQNPGAPSGNPVAFLSAASGPNLTYTRRKRSLSGLTYSVWTSTNLSGWTEDTGAVQTATAITGTDNESVDVTLSAGIMNADRLFIRIKAR